MPIEIKIDLARVNAKPPLRALADVTLRFSDGEVTVQRCAVFQNLGEPPWANLPHLHIERDGKKTFVSLIELPRDLKQRLLKEIIAEYLKHGDAN